MFSNRLRFLPVIVIMPLALGIGIGIGGVGVASAVPIANAVTPALTVLLCASTGACATFTNSAKGAGVLGSSSQGAGVKGTSQYSVGVVGNSVASVGVYGNSVSADAIHGVSQTSNGIVGDSGGTTTAGIFGRNTHSVSGGEDIGGPGIQASSIAGSGLVVSNGPDPYSGLNFGGVSLAISPTVRVDATKTLGDGIDISTNELDGGADIPHSGPAIVAADGSGTNANVGGAEAAIGADNESYLTSGGYGAPGMGMFGYSNYGNGLVGSTSSTGSVISNPGYPYLTAAITAQANKGADLYVGYGSSGTFEVTNDGNVNASGTVTSGVSCAPTTCPSGTQLAAYATREASPTIEDFGRAQLVNGAATVLLDRMFMGVIDSTQNYSVFITPEGDTRGLYVANRTPRGFTVAENLLGTSSVAFSYRIVASPYGVKTARLPASRMRQYAASAFSQQAQLLNTMKARSTKAFARSAKVVAPSKNTKK